MKQFLFLFFAILLFSCGKDELMIDPQQDQITNQAQISPRIISIADLPDSLWISPTHHQLNGIWDDMMDKANVDQVGSFLYEHGLFDWSRARLIKAYDDDFILSIPTIEDDAIASILFVSKVGMQYTYWHLSIDEMMLPTAELILHHGAKNTLLAVLEFIKHEQCYGGYTHVVLLDHYYSNDLQDEIVEILPRGWCLVEILLYIVDGPGEYSEATGTTYDADKNVIAYGDRVVGKADINGQDIGGGFKLIRIWAWCPDEIDQDPYSNNWTTNIEGTGGNGGNTDNGPNWDYDTPRWTEDTKECMFTFDDPKATEKINKLEEELLTASCGDASEYIIKSMIDNMILELCEEYYQNQDGSEGGPLFPVDEGHDTNETLNTISTSIESHSIYELGMEVCEVCEEINPPAVCYNLVNNCPPDNYEDCVNDVLCDYAIADFEENYSITLSQEDKEAIKAYVSSCGDEDFDDDAFHVINCITKSNDYITVLNNTVHCDELDPPLSMSEDCPKLANILEIVVGEDGTDPHCGMLKDLGVSKGEIQYSWDCDLSKIKPRTDGTFPLGQTTYNLDTKQVKVFLSSELCEKSCSEILSIVIHESIHAKLKSMVLEKLPDPDPFNHIFPTAEDFQITWNEIKKENFEGVQNEHKIMAEYYTKEYAKAMYNMVGEGKWEDYLYWAYRGLGVEPHELIGTDNWQTHQDNWDAIKAAANSNLNCE